MSELCWASLADLSEVAHWIGSGNQARNWAGERVTYPVDSRELPRQIQWPDALSFCLLNEGALIGFGQLVPKSRGRLHLARLIIRPSHRGKGYGRELAESVLDEALSRKPSVVSLNVFPDNKAAVELYRRIGFVAADREPGDAQDDARYMLYKT